MFAHAIDRSLRNETWLKARPSYPLSPRKPTMSQRLARAAYTLENARTHHGRPWVAVFMIEKTIVIALHGSLTPAEQSLANSPAGNTLVSQFHRQLLANARLRQKITDITGMGVFATAVEIDAKRGSVVLLFTTDTAPEEYQPVPHELAGCL